MILRAALAQVRQQEIAPSMSAAAFASLVTLPVVIVAPGRFVTRGGQVVDVAFASEKHDFGCRGSYSTGQAEGWHKSGRLYFSQESANDIVGVAPVLTADQARRVRESIAECDRDIAREAPRDADLRPVDVRERLDFYRAHRARLVTMLAPV
jgi:hypothetical protein